MADNNKTIADIQFEDLYRFIDSTGVTIPYMDEVKTAVENTFRQIFGADLDVSEETPTGRLIEAISIMFIQVIGVNAQNANGFNVRTATGSYLDALGNLFGVRRTEEELDGSLRNKILSGGSRGNGFVQSVINEIQKIGSDIKSVYALENGRATVAALPLNTNASINVDPHSVYVAVNYDDSNDYDPGSAEFNERKAEIQALEQKIAVAIYKTKAAGCAYTISDEYGTRNEVEITDEKGNATTKVYFYKPDSKKVSVELTVKNNLYTGTDIVQAAKDTILKLFADNGIGSVTTALEIASAVSANGTGTSVTSIKLKVGNIEQDKVEVNPSEFADITAEDIEVTVE